MKSKGDAQDAWLKQKGNGITNQHEFENAWRQSYDPVLFQLETANPAERNKLIQSLPAAEAASLAGKRAGLKALGVTLP
jgi:NifB/MoaA-like Fe-S oxidoreductase